MNRAKISKCFLFMAIALGVYVLALIGQFLSAYAGSSAEAVNMFCLILMTISGFAELISTAVIIREDRNFLYSLIFVVLEVGSAVVLSLNLVAAGSILYSITQFISMIGGIIASCFFCLGIRKAAEEFDKDGLIQPAKNCVTTFGIFAILAILLTFVSQFLTESSTGILVTVAMLISVGYVAFNIAAYTRYLMLLFNAYKVLG